MPIYEYSCNACSKRLSIFVRSMNSPVSARCDSCGSEDLVRLISKVAVVRSLGENVSPLDDSMFDDAMFEGYDQDDPQSMAAWARNMRDKVGAELGPEFDDAVERLERGESLDDVMGDDEGGAYGDDDFGFGDDDGDLF